MSDIDGETIEIPCCKCRATTVKTVAWLRKHKQFVCECGALVRVTPSTFDHEIAKVAQQVDRLKHAIEQPRQNNSKL